ncbi:MAG: aminopeptidase P family protein [Deltaproteobacteria bacterium]|nr:aminopeptidase P family protein [Deltaproteobacteria bacterium]
MSGIETYTPLSEISARIRKLQDSLVQKKIEGVLILQQSDLFYFSGTSQQAHLYVPAEGDPVLMVRKDSDRAKKESPLKKILPFKSPRQIPEIIKENSLTVPLKLGMELDVLPANLYFNFQHVFDKTEIIDISHTIRLIRAVKSSYETDMIRKAAQMSDRVAAIVPEILSEGISEIELAGLIEAEARSLGHQGIIKMRLFGAELFYGHVMAGPSAAVTSYLSSPTGGPGVSPAIAQGPGFRKVKANEPVLVDFVCVYRGYLSDHTRIFAVNGLPDDLLSAQESMLDVQNLIKREARPGVSAGNLYDMAVERASELGYADYFMGVGESRIRFIGHGVGLELDEYPFLAKGQDLQLQEGMVIALEPKVIFPGKGVVGIENTHLVTAGGLEQFGKFKEDISVV